MAIRGLIVTQAALALTVLAGCTTPDFRFAPEPGSGGQPVNVPPGSAGAEAAGGDGSGGSGVGGGNGGNGGTGGDTSAGTSGGGGVSASGAPSDAGAAGSAPVESHPAGTGLQFDGTSYITFGAAPADDLTIEMWISTTTKGGSPNFYNGAALFFADVPTSRNDFGATIVGDSFAFGTGSPDVTALSETPVNTGRWVHVAGTRKRSTGIVRVIVNGRAESTLVTGNNKALSDADLPWMGGRLDDMTVVSAFSGIIDEVRLWNVARTSLEISESMNIELKGDEPGLVGYWRFDEGSGLLAADSSPSNAPAKLGGADSTHAPKWVSYPAQQ